MKFVIVFAALVAVCAAAPVDSDAGAVIVRSTSSNDGVHGYEFNYETSNGIVRNEHGVLKPIGENGVIVVDGDVSWISPEGEHISLKFVADENGYQPVV